MELSGYDGLIVQGKSDRPVCLFIHDGLVELKDIANDLEGRDAPDDG